MAGFCFKKFGNAARMWNSCKGRGWEREKVESGRVGGGKGGVVVVGKSLLLTLNSSYFFSFFIF